MAPAKPALNSPSADWLAIRTASSRPNSGMARTDRHTATGARTSTTEVTFCHPPPGGAEEPTVQIPGQHSLIAPIALCWCHDGDVAHSEDPEDYAPTAHRVRSGTLLLANTDLLEPTFRRSVIYVVEHNDGGTL